MKRGVAFRASAILSGLGASLLAFTTAAAIYAQGPANEADVAPVAKSSMNFEKRCRRRRRRTACGPTSRESTRSENPA